MRWATAALLVAVLTAGRAAAGERWLVIRTMSTASQGSDGSRSDATHRDALLERVLAVQPDGLELEYDLPPDATPAERERTWQLPVRVLRPADGPARLLNRADLDQRLAAWLARAGLTRAACGHWLFTWTAIRIECDPQSAVDLVASFDLRQPALRPGALIRDREAAAPGTLSVAVGGGLMARLMIDPGRIRRSQAEADVAAAEIGRKPLALADALRARAGELVAGTVTVTFQTDTGGAVRRRTRLVELSTGSGATARRTTSTETVERRAVPDGLGD